MRGILALIITILFISSWGISLWFCLLIPIFAIILALLTDQDYFKFLD